MHYLIYMSTAVKLFTDADLKELLRQSQANNAINNLTGMLLYSEGSFVQALEGEKAQVDATYANIVKDTRHKNIIKLIDGAIAERAFPNWSMGFKTMAKQEFVEFEAYFNPMGSTLLKDESQPVITILKAFADNNKM